MTEAEKKILDKLTEAHNEFLLLPVQHPSDIQEWVCRLHELQRMIMCREAVRNNPEYYYDRGTNNQS